MNKDLYDKFIEFPKDRQEHMKICFERANCNDETTEGFKRNKELQGKNYITYKQLKRIKNFFDNFKGNQNETPFILNGGFPMKNWVNNELRKMRDGIKMTKRNKMDTGMMNQFLKPHDKKDFTNVRPSQQHKSTMEKYNSAVTESLKRINEIMSKI